MSVPLTNQQVTEMSEAEWQTRCDLAALYRIVNYLGWTDLLQTHMSARVPGEPNAFLINRLGDMFDEICASNLVKMDLDGSETLRVSTRRALRSTVVSTKPGQMRIASCIHIQGLERAFRCCEMDFGRSARTHCM